MRSLDEQSHYEALEVSENASREQIDRAYRVACATYSDDSIALYSLFDAGDADTIRERIRCAYRVLSDPAARADYDAQLGGGQTLGAAGPAPSATEVPAPSAKPLPQEPLVPVRDRSQARESAGEDIDYDGPGLRRIRLRRGVEIEQIASETKINTTYLRFIEEESFDSLPAPVYVRGFVSAYARTLGLDAAVVATSYMSRLTAAEVAKRPSRRLRR